MITLPQPLHPAMVHFPIALILLGALCAVTAAFVRRWNLPLFAAVLLSFGALGAIAAGQTGEREEDAAEHAAGGKALLKQHETWADRTCSLALVSAGLAIAAVAAARWSRTARGLGAVAAIVALGAGWCVIQTGHAGGQLVYGHGAGVALTSQSSAESGEAAARADRNRRRPDHRDHR